MKTIGLGITAVMALLCIGATLQHINVGQSPNDGTGDSLRNAFIKTTNNFLILNTNKLESTNGYGVAGYTLISDGSHWYAAPASGLTNTFIWPDLVNGGSSQFIIRYKTNGIVFEYVDTFGVITTNLFFTTNGIIQFPNGLYVGAPMTVNTQIVNNLFLPNLGSNSLLRVDSTGKATNTPSGSPGQVFVYTSLGGQYSNQISVSTISMNGGGSNTVFDTEIAVNSNAWFRQSAVISNELAFKVQALTIATNSTANSNLTANFDCNITEAYLTNNISITNFSNTSTTDKRTIKFVFMPQLINRTVVYPTPGVAGFGMRWWTNQNHPLLTTLTAGNRYELELESIDTNINAKMLEFK